MPIAVTYPEPLDTLHRVGVTLLRHQLLSRKPQRAVCQSKVIFSKPWILIHKMEIVLSKFI
jgi:hypothetical protein